MALRPTLLMPLIVAAAVAGCALEVQNRQPAQELAQAAKPPGSVYTGWRVFQERCAGCHGEAATGTAKAPNLLERVQTLGPRSFVSRVLYRYDWGIPAAQAANAPPHARVQLFDDAGQELCPGLALPGANQHGATELVEDRRGALRQAAIGDVEFERFDGCQFPAPVEPQLAGVMGRGDG